ncbi:MAG: nicotinate-nucleotide--dimethylbenzimidazole phosphoribosyltransferase [Paenibacillaceae bacterium]
MSSIEEESTATEAELTRQLNNWLERVEPTDDAVRSEALAYIDTLTKPPGSLGGIEQLVVDLAGITREVKPKVSPAAVIVMAADHGIAVEGVSAYPQEVTAQMVANFLQGGAAINVFARQIGAEVTVVDMGVAANLEAWTPKDTMTRLELHKIRKGTANMLSEAAMTRSEAITAILVGVEIAENAIKRGAKCIIPGEMGIGNTTSSSAIVALLSGHSVEAVTGPGTGIEGERLLFKQRLIEKAIALHLPDQKDGLDVLMKVGGLEIAGITGLIIGAAVYRIPVLLDGFICGAAALVARSLNLYTVDYMVAGHLSLEPGHRIVLEVLGKKPLLQLQLRLGEGSGAALAYPLLEAASRMISEMATFQSAGISDSN